jgi:hypothetical protein
MCFIGSKPQKKVDTFVLRQELMMGVSNIKSIIFPSGKKWVGYAFIIFYNREALDKFLARKTINLPKTNIVLNIKPHTSDNKSKKAKLKDKNLRMLFFRNVPEHFTSEYFIKCVSPYGLLKSIGEKYSEVPGYKHFYLFFSTKKITNLIYERQAHVFANLVHGFNCRMQKIKSYDTPDLEGYSVIFFKKSESDDEGPGRMVRVDPAKEGSNGRGKNSVIQTNNGSRNSQKSIELPNAGLRADHQQRQAFFQN